MRSERPQRGAQRDDAITKLIGEVLGQSELRQEELLTTLRATRAAFFAEQLLDMLDRIASESKRKRGHQLIESAGGPFMSDVLRSPALCELVRCGHTDNDLFALLSLQADGIAGWSPLGDLWHGLEPPATFQLTELEPGIWHGPTTYGGIPIDGSLPVRIAHPHGGMARPRYPDVEETAIFVERLNRALGALEEVYPFGSSLFQCVASNIVIRIDEERPKEVWGASSGLAMGRILVVNGHLDESPRLLAEKLLHEAVHCAIDCAEIVKPLYLPTSASAQVGIQSPWSGNQLSPHAFAHATAVWCVLLHYWKELDADGVDEPLTRSRIDYITRGFDRLDEATVKSAFAGTLTTSALSLVEAGRMLATQ